MEARRGEGSAAEAEVEVETTADGVHRQSEARCRGGRNGKLGDDKKAVMVELVPAEDDFVHRRWRETESCTRVV